MAGSVFSRTLQKAAEIVGGQARLCRILKVPQAELSKWIQNQGEPPQSVFLAAVDIVVDEARTLGGGSEPPDPPAPRDAAGGDPHPNK